MFVFDPDKSALNKDKHGIDFVEAQALWHDPRQLEIPADYDGEPRWIVTGNISGRMWSAVFTRRAEAIRIISVRRARKREVEQYESQEKNHR